jgi:hypothetical protein
MVLRFMGSVVVHDDVDVEPVGNAGVDLLEEVQELGWPVALVTLADHKAGSDVEGRKARPPARATI